MSKTDSGKSDAGNSEPNNLDPQATKSNPKESRSAAEQISFFIALIILLGIIGSVGYLWVSDRAQSPAVLQISTKSIEQREASYYLPFTVTNLGGQTAATVQVIAELRINNEIVEWGEQTIDFLSQEQEAEGTFIFVRNPDEGELTVRVASYSKP